MINLGQITGKVLMAFNKRRPEILMGIGIAGMISVSVMAVKATPKALRLLEEAEKKKGEKLTKRETVKTAWKCYVPAAITGGLSVACLIGAGSENARRRAALATAFSLSESALKEYREKVKETIGERKEQAVRDAIAKDKIDNDPVSKSEVILTEKGNTLCYDGLSGRYFKSDIDKLKKAVNELNRRMISEMVVSVNDFYSEIGIGQTKVGNDLGWNVNSGFIDLQFSSQLADDGTPCLVLNYGIAPTYDYSRW